MGGLNTFVVYPSLFMMNAPVSRSAATLVGIGAVAILLLGAFTRRDTTVPAPPPEIVADTPAAPDDSAAPSAGLPEVPSKFSPGLAEIVKLAQAHSSEDVIVAYIRSSRLSYSPTAEEILYLKDLGLSQKVLSALYEKNGLATNTLASAAVNATPPEASAPAPEPDLHVFHDALAPYGAWTQLPDYGSVWQPTTATINPDWRPYLDEGQWIYADNDWYWHSGYSWGWAVFHYGRWLKDPRLGWVWVPGKTWGPAWVSWRIALAYAGWAPLPPGVGLATAGSLLSKMPQTASSATLLIPPGWFTFVSEENMLDQNLSFYTLSTSDSLNLHARSVAVNVYTPANARAINLGPDRLVDVPQASMAAVSIPPRGAPSTATVPMAGDIEPLAVAAPPRARHKAISASIKPFRPPPPIFGRVAEIIPPHITPPHWERPVIQEPTRSSLETPHPYLETPRQLPELPRLYPPGAPMPNAPEPPGVHQEAPFATPGAGLKSGK